MARAGTWIMPHGDSPVFPMTGRFPGADFQWLETGVSLFGTSKLPLALDEGVELIEVFAGKIGRDLIAGSRGHFLKIIPKQSTARL
jgi:hypothetical protein